MAGEDWPEDPQAEGAESTPGEGEAEAGAGGDDFLDEDVLVVLPDEQTGGEGLDSFFEEAEANVEPAAVGESAAEEGPAAEAPAVERAVDSGPLPVTVLDLYADGIPFVDPQVREYVDQGYLFFIVNAGAVGYVDEPELRPLVDLDGDVRAQGGQLVFCNLQDVVKTAIHEMGLYDHLSLTETEEEAIDWTRKVVMENTGSDVEISRVPLGTEGSVPEPIPGEPPPLEAMVTQDMLPEESDEVVDLGAEAIVEEAPFPAEQPLSEMVTQEIPEEEFEEYTSQGAEAPAEAPHKPRAPSFEPPSFAPVGMARVGPMTIRPKKRRPILLGVLLLGIVAIAFSKAGSHALRLLGLSKTPVTVATGPGTGGGGPDLVPVTPDTDGETTEGGTTEGETTEGGKPDTTTARRTVPAEDDPERESARYREILSFSLNELIERP